MSRHKGNKNKTYKQQMKDVENNMIEWHLKTRLEKVKIDGQVCYKWKDESI